jgi:hypothetical protein
MRQTTGTRKSPSEQLVKDIKRVPQTFLIGIKNLDVLVRLRGEVSIADALSPHRRFKPILADAAPSTYLH